MPYLHCPRCHRTAWVRKLAGDGIDVPELRHAASARSADGDAALLTTAVRERFARDARRDAGRERFVRDPRAASASRIALPSSARAITSFWISLVPS